jgi:hypothetical protein
VSPSASQKSSVDGHDEHATEVIDWREPAVVQLWGGINNNSNNSNGNRSSGNSNSSGNNNSSGDSGDINNTDINNSNLITSTILHRLVNLATGTKNANNLSASIKTQVF